MLVIIFFNPSPNQIIYPCGACDKPVTWDDRGIVARLAINGTT